MKRMVKTINAIYKRPTLQMLFGFVLVLSILVLGNTIFKIGEDYYNKQLARTEYFDIKSVEYVKHEGDSLVFLNTAIIKRSLPMTMNDILRCEDGSHYVFYSNQNRSDATPEISDRYQSLEWNYNEPFPTGKKCYLEKTIVMTAPGGHPKSQQIKSSEFVVK